MADWKASFLASDLAAVNQAVKEAEGVTSAEIVPVIARSSGRYDRPEDTIGVWTGVVLMCVVWMVLPAEETGLGSWSETHPLWHLAALIVAMLFGFLAGAFLGSRCDWLTALFTPRQQMLDEVRRRSQAVFYDSRVHHTAGSTGILLYVSLMERMAAVLADEVVLQKLGQARIDLLCRDFTRRLHNSSPTKALCETTRELGEALHPVLPRDAADVNELPDALRLLD
jgi:putative membrane protein